MNVSEIQKSIETTIEPFVSELSSNDVVNESKRLYDAIYGVSDRIHGIYSWLSNEDSYLMSFWKKLAGIGSFISRYDERRDEMNFDMIKIKSDVDIAFVEFKEVFESMTTFILSLDKYASNYHTYESELSEYVLLLRDIVSNTSDQNEKQQASRVMLTAESLIQNMKLSYIKMNNIANSSKSAYESMKRTYEIFEWILRLNITMESTKRTKTVVDWSLWDFWDSLSSLWIEVEKVESSKPVDNEAFVEKLKVLSESIEEIKKGV